MKNQMFSLGYVTGLLMLCLLPGMTRATEFSSTDWDVSYSTCLGYVEINILYFDAEGINDWMSILDLYYQNSSGTFVQILKWRHESETCSGCNFSTSFDGETFNYQLTQGSSVTTLSTFTVPNSDSNLRKFRVRFYDLPNDLFGTTVTLRINGYWDGGGSDGDVNISNWDKTVSVPSIGNPSNLTASVDQFCDKVALSWTNPSSSCPDSLIYTSIFRDNVFVGQTSDGLSSYNDLTAVKGTSYQYKIRTEFRPNGFMQNITAFTSEVLGRRLGPLAAPTNITATNDRCDGKILVQWSWASATNPTSFIVQRKTVSGSTYTPLDTINGTLLQLLDTTPLPDSPYLYRVISVNTCGDLSTPSTANTQAGQAAGPPAAPTNLTATAGPASITITWMDNSITENGFLIERTFTGGGSPLINEVPANTTSFVDNSVQNCVTYTYKVKAKSVCFPTGVGNNTVSQRIQQNLSNTFPAGSFQASKGYDPDKVILEWNNNNSNLINIIRIYRRILESGDNYALLFTLNSGSGIYNDVFTDAGVLYEYLIYAEGQCENETLYSDSTTSIGFRRKVGTVTGQVTYAGGTAVENVKLSAESTTGIYGRSLSFLGGNADIVIPDANDLDFDTTFLVEAWIRPVTNLDNGKIFEKQNSFSVQHVAADKTYRARIHKTNLLYFDVSVPDSLVPLNNYSHLAVQIHNRRVQIYVNGNLEKDQSLIAFYSGAAHLQITTSDIAIGQAFKGHIDEIRIWNHSKTPEQIKRDYSRILIGTEPNLKVYLNTNEGVGRYAYDASKTGLLFNKHHAAFVDSVSWSNNVPTASQLSVANYTNATGNYTLIVPYNGAGDVFEITPSFTIHEFEPSVTALFIGDGASVHNNINFRDKSSFRVTGTVNFKNTTCGVPNAFLKVDGAILITEGVPAKTDATGAFDIRVPIGMHHIEVEQAGHVYSVGRFPATGKYDFNEDLAGIAFTDSTLVNVVGRVVGGLREANKVPGLGKSKNNIGVARIILKSQQGNGCAIDTIFTNAMTGEYSVMLPPLKYDPFVTIPTNPTINFGVLNVVDLSTTPILMTAFDTLFDVDGTTVVEIDSVQFHRRLDYVYRVNPEIAVYDRDGVSPFIGDSIFTFVDPNTNLLVDRNLRTNPFRWPVFSERDGGAYVYRCMVKVFEKYTNLATSAVDSVPTTDGVLKVINEFAEITTDELQMKDYNTPDTLKSIVYSFRVGKPNFQENLSIPEYSFTRKLEIILVTSGGTAISWLPVTNIPVGGDAIYRAYLLGTNTNSAQFVTFGPEVPEYVLRDPPGSNSKASREVGSAKTEKSSWNWTLGGSLSTKDDIYIGAEFNVGLGVSTATKVKNNTTVGFKAEIGGGNSGYQSITTTNTKTWSTNDATQIAPGAPSDVYIGTSRNLQFGIAEELTIALQDECAGIECIGGTGTEPDTDFTFGKRLGLSVVPGGYETQFQFTEYAIKNTIIPDLYTLRDAMLQSNPKYVSHLPIGDPNYGLNNDDPVFGANVSSSTPDFGDFEDLTGPSYTYNAVSLQDSVTGDSVRIINTQIDKWVDAITLNEWEKVHIDDQDAIDSLKETELDALDEAYADTEEAYDALVIANGLAGIVVAYGLIVTPGPGSAIGGFATFAVTAATGIALAELTTAHETYLHKKQLIEEKFALLGEPANYTLSGGTSLSSSMTHQSSASYTQALEYTLTAELLIEVSGRVNGAGVGLEKGLELKHTIGRDWSTDNDTTETVEFTLQDDDVGDHFSVDVFPSILGWGPVFKNKAGGATSCPHEDAVVTEYYLPGTTISERTLQIEKPTISSSQSLLTNIPADQPAVFNLTLGNNAENGYTNEYNLSVLSHSNPFGAIVRFDGLPSQSVIIPGNAAVNKVMTIQKGPGPVYNYDSIMVVFASPCQYTAGAGFNTDIGDTVYVSAHFLPACTKVSLASPEDKWTLNNFYHDTMPVAIIDYNINYDALENIRFEYKPSSSSNWLGLQTFLKDTFGVGGVPIPTSTPFTLYDWDVAQLTDGFYDVRVSSTCANQVQAFSATHSGVIDRINPHPFGHPSPADGILSPNDEISIRFNEPIDLGSINPAFNFDIRGVTNGTATDQSTSLFFNGTTNYARVEGGLPIQQRDFTIEFSAKRARTGEEALFSMGTDVNESLFIGFNAANKFAIRINGTEIASNNAFTDQIWHYFAVSYDAEGETVQLFVADEFNTAYIANNGNLTLYPDITTLNALEIGRNSVTGAQYFKGNICEVRVWNTSRTLNQFSVSKSILISSADAGILYNWRMDEADGITAADHIRRRDAGIYGATWQVSPQGNAVQLDGINDAVKIASGDVAITQGMDFTLEFWFNSSTTSAGTMWSNGLGDGVGGDSLFSWQIQKEADGKIRVLHDGISFYATEQNFFDGGWHHFALVMDRSGNLSSYVDGDLQNSTQAVPFHQLAGPNMYLGATGFIQFNMDTINNYFTGKLDEFRFWNTARTLAQIRRDKQNRMQGDEFGLKVYLPFEHFSIDPTGIPILTPSFNDQVVNPHIVTALNGTALIAETPTIKLRRPVQKIAFTYSVNHDQIIITPTTSPEIIENVTLDVTTQGIKDLRGNVMESPATWIAYIDKNQVIWQDDQLQFDIWRGNTLSFSSAVINQGGAAKVFRIENIPSWLTVTPSSGTVNPNSSIAIQFQINPAVNLGTYTQDIILLTDFNFPERLTLQLKVRAPLPAWTFDPAGYEYNMSMVGRLKINNVISTDDEDMILAMVGQEVRGMGQLEYVPGLDVYLVFLDVYSTTGNAQLLSFHIWDASSGLIYTDVLPTNISFQTNQIVGSPVSPITFEAGNTVSFEVPIYPGWSWLGFPLAVPVPTDINNILISLTHTAGDVIKGQTEYCNYNGNSNQFVGTLDDPGKGIKPEQMYKLYNQLEDILIMKGTVINPTTKPITLANGWNWIGFISIRNQPLTQALGNLTPFTGDIIKGKTNFAVYDAAAGWIGSLSSLKPGAGYMYKSNGTNSFTYPLAGMFNPVTGSEEETIAPRSPKWIARHDLYSGNMTIIGQLQSPCEDKFYENHLDIGIMDKDGRVRAVGNVDEIAGQPMTFLTVAGDEPEMLDVFVLDSDQHTAFPTGQQIYFQPNWHIGELSTPMTFPLPSGLCEYWQNVNSDIEAQTLSVYPTPFQESITVRYYSAESDETGSITLRDLEGRICHHEVVDILPGENEFLVHLVSTPLPAGVYVVALQSRADLQTMKIVKAR